MAAPSKDKEPEFSPLVRYLKYSHLGLQFCISVGLPTGVGIWADRRLGTGVLLTLTGLVLGFGAGVYALCYEVFPPRKLPDREGRSGHPTKSENEGPGKTG